MPLSYPKQMVTILMAPERLKLLHHYFTFLALAPKDDAQSCSPSSETSVLSAPVTLAEMQA
ncbi:hypothetical protein [Vibrio ruber]|uniref:hypothetical protein n=1 Tax=Vibrio ruber TaxID=184755 RepID=UPI0011154FD8|nr:hypothetical protein [Vibrio ruber]